MPDSVLIAQDGSLWTVDGDDLLGTMREVSLRGATRLIDTSGPMDTVEYSRASRAGLELTARHFVPAAGAAALDLIGATTAFTVTCDLLDGRTLTGTFLCPDAGATANDDANEQSMTLKSTGTWTIA